MQLFGRLPLFCSSGVHKATLDASGSLWNPSAHSCLRALHVQAFIAKMRCCCTKLANAPRTHFTVAAGVDHGAFACNVLLLLVRLPMSLPFRSRSFHEQDVAHFLSKPTPLAAAENLSEMDSIDINTRTNSSYCTGHNGVTFSLARQMYCNPRLSNKNAVFCSSLRTRSFSKLDVANRRPAFLADGNIRRHNATEPAGVSQCTQAREHLRRRHTRTQSDQALTCQSFLSA